MNAVTDRIILQRAMVRSTSMKGVSLIDDDHRRVPPSTATSRRWVPLAAASGRDARPSELGEEAAHGDAPEPGRHVVPRGRLVVAVTALDDVMVHAAVAEGVQARGGVPG